jgi:hypothetical protein
MGGCVSRPPHIPEREPQEVTPSLDEESTAETSSALSDTPVARLHMPPSRTHVLDLLARFQSAVSSGEPPLGEVLAKTAVLSAPTLETRRVSPNRNAISGALGANFASPTLIYDPRDVSVTAGETGAVARVPLEVTTGASPRRIVLALELRYAEGSLRIDQITLSRAP